MIVALLVAASLADGKVQTFDVGREPRVEIANLAGDIEVFGEERGDVTVKAEREGGTEEERARWTVEVSAASGEVRVEACCGACGRTRRRCDGSGEVKVRFELHVPRGARLDVSTVSGDVAVKGVAGEQRLNSVSGDARVEGSAHDLEVHTVSGSVELAPGSVGRTAVNSVSGSVRLRLPAGADARVSLSTVSGKLDGVRGGGHVVLGKGTARIDVETVSGSVSLR